MIIFHNSRCGKSREALDLLIRKGYDVTIREYLKEPPTTNELKSILKKLNCKAIDIIRKKESFFQENYQNKVLSDMKWIKVLIKNPILIERPIIITDKKAIIARPTELLNDFLKKEN